MRKPGALLVAVLAVATLAGRVAAERAARVDAFAAADRVRALPAEAESTAFVKPGTVIQTEPRLGVPTFVWAAPRAVPPDARRPEEAARRYLAEFAPLYRLAPADASAATVRAVHDTGRGVIVVKLREEVEGIEVFREELRVAMRRDLSLVSLSGYLSGAPARAGKGLARTYRLSARAAIEAAYQEGGGGLVPADLRARDEQGGPYARFDLAGRAESGEAVNGGARIKKVLFHLPDQFVPAYYVELDLGSDAGTDGTLTSFVVSGLDGSILFRNELTASDSYSYRVWAETASPRRPFDGPQGNSASPHPTGSPNGFQPAFVAPNVITLQNGPISTNDPWLPPASGETVGNNVDAYADLASPDGLSAGDFRASTTSPGTFDRTYDVNLQPNDSPAQIMAATTQLFYDVNFFHDWYYDSGFDEASGNAQLVNYGRGGIEGDPIHAEAQDSSGTNNANMSTPSDGGSPRMQMYVWTANSPRNVTANPPGATYGSGAAQFGPSVFDVTTQVVLVNDGVSTTTDGCEAIVNNVAGKIALIDRGICSFKQKIVNAQTAGAVGVIVANNVSGSAPTMPDGTPAVTVTIPSLSVSQTDGNAIKTALGGGAVTTRLYRPFAPTRDGTIDNTVVAHEWGHYISNRLVGDGNGLGNVQGRGMGEGWGDFHALLLMVRPEDSAVPSNSTFQGVYALTAYVTGGTTTLGAGNEGFFFGIRRYPYSTDLTKNPLTFQHISSAVALPPGVPQSGRGSANNAEVHNVGEVWANALWECYASILRDTLGGAPRLTFDQAQQRMKDYVVAGYKLTPADPTFVEARDAILAAIAANDLTDYTLCSQAFARRGMGLRAVAPDRYSTDNVGVIESYTSGNDLAFVSAALGEAASPCDTDGVVDAGENGTLTITLRNVGIATLSATSATISSTNPAVTFPSGTTLDFPASQPTQTTTAAIPIHLAVVGTIQQVDFSIAFRDAAFTIPGDLLAAASYGSNTDDLAGTTRTDGVECVATPWTLAGDPAFEPAIGWRRTAISALDHRWLGPDPGAGPTDQYLVSPSLQVSAAGSFSFTFRHRFSFENDAVPTYYDGGVLEISTDDGNTWADIGASAIPGYTGTISTCCDNPLGGRPGYVKTNASYPSLDTVTVSLGTAYQGDAVRVRFRLATDQASGGAGWEIDDLAFTGIDNTPFCVQIADRGLCLHPGRVPATGAEGTVLRVGKNAGNHALIDLTWGASCGNDVGAYAVYQGTLGSYYNEVPLGCAVSGTSLLAQTPGSGARYYLVAPLSSVNGKEGSHGSRTSGERPLGPSACRPVLDTAPCQ